LSERARRNEQETNGGEPDQRDHEPPPFITPFALEFSVGVCLFCFSAAKFRSHFPVVFRLIAKNRQISAIRKRTTADRPAPITKKILLSSALGRASNVEPTRTAADPIFTATPKMIQWPFGGSVCVILRLSPSVSA
jgi:hypothetical protein